MASNTVDRLRLIKRTSRLISLKSRLKRTQLVTLRNVGCFVISIRNLTVTDVELISGHQRASNGFLEEVRRKATCQFHHHRCPHNSSQRRCRASNFRGKSRGTLRIRSGKENSSVSSGIHAPRQAQLLTSKEC